MKNIIWKFCAQHEQYIQTAASILTEQIIKKPNSLFTLATGQSPKDVYTRWVQEIKEQKINTEQMIIHKLDEWVGLPSGHKGTCERFLQENVLDPLSIDMSHYLSVSAETEEPKNESDRMHKELEKKGYSDVCVLGLGRNGHLGLNEPGEFLYPNTYTAELSNSSQNHAMLSGAKVFYGITMGIGEILRSRHIVLLVSGTEKEKAVESLYSSAISTQNPASFLFLHPKVTIVLDQYYSEKFSN
ncbi:MAG: 6-phosphogluconolactonase [Spirochaetia bacterium]|nr:6-phosphogluconolactonase [Spirochaetia bacterium]